ncbi:aspartyl protease family protein [Candidatus Gottesmanbacteria bacterium]|nr:aspartyl protease family protein [Candidatus Gottesmanbacteria bacterium]
MGVTNVTLRLKSPSDPTKTVSGEFLVDSGAHYTVLPAAMAKTLGLKPSYSQKFSLADGRIMERKISAATIRLDNRELPAPVVIGEKSDSALLGVTTLEAFGMMIDPFTRQIYKSKLMLA